MSWILKDLPLGIMLATPLGLRILGIILRYLLRTDVVPIVGTMETSDTYFVQTGKDTGRTQNPSLEPNGDNFFFGLIFPSIIG